MVFEKLSVTFYSLGLMTHILQNAFEVFDRKC